VGQLELVGTSAILGGTGLALSEHTFRLGSRSGKLRREGVNGEDVLQGGEEGTAMLAQGCQVAATNNVANDPAEVLARGVVGRSERRR
jgi:hypothetical protein